MKYSDIGINENNELGVFKLLIEHDAGFISKEFTKGFLKEGTINETLDLTKPIFYYSTLQKYGVENRNGRIYPEDILKRQVEIYKDVIRKNASFHEMDHPDSSTISLKGGSPYRIVDLFWKGNALIGKLEVLVSDGYRRSGIISCNGDLLAHYLSYGMTVGISSRGIGTLKKVNGKNMVQDDFELICWDAVSSPSTPGSYLYQDINDFGKYDEVLPDKKDEIEESSNGNDFLKNLQKFLNR